MKTMVILFIVYAVAMAVATFIENDFGTTTARTLIYNSKWFELIMVLLAINLVGNIIRFKLYKKNKWPVFLFHIAFLLILIGAAVTRYISFEGMMPIKEGETADSFMTEKTYLKIHVDDGQDQFSPPIRKNLALSAIDLPLLTDNHYHLKTQFKNKPIEVEVLDYVPHAQEAFKSSDKGEKYLKFVVSTPKGRKDVYLKDGQVSILNDRRISFNNIQDATINIFEKKDSLFILSPFPGTYMRMSDQKRFPVKEDSIQGFHLSSLYQFGNTSFVVTDNPIKGNTFYETGNKDLNPLDVLVVKVKSGEEEKTVGLYGGQYAPDSPKVFRLNGLNFRLNFGPEHKRLPFQIKLNDFKLEKYPGSTMPKSYESEVTVITPEKSFDARIYMNHPLEYKGYRFYQSSYTITPEYEQTQLSVNHDFWGTWITYIGYTLLYIGLLMIFFVKGTRFSKLKELVSKTRKNREKIAVILFMFTYSIFAQQDKQIQIDSIIIKTIAPKEKAENFGHLVIQDYGGRMKPVNTYASELLRKLSKHDTYTLSDGTEITADQVLTGMISYPEGWWYVPVIYLERGDERVREIIGVSKDTKYARLVDFFDRNTGEYKLQKYLEEAQKKRIKGKFDKDIVNISGRVNLLFNTLNTENLRLFPLPGDRNHKWYSWREISRHNFNADDKNFAVNAIPLWSKEIFKAKETGDFSLADDILEGINKYQLKFGKEVYPKGNKIKWEIFYNKYDAFRSLFWQFMMISLFVFVFAIVEIFVGRKKWIKYINLFFYTLAALLTIKMIFFLILRWYISGHAPWSNAYESMIYVAFATIMAGLILGRKSALTLASTLFIGSMMLMIAHWNWMDPQIENLNPVLDSYWLNIHVAIIVASYGPFAVGMMLGLISLLLMALTNENNKTKMESYIKELTYITEMSLIIGLVMLTIGNFLGGQWANESWGRYWGWDPKETWALISIVVYALVIHARLVPGLRGLFTFNFLAVISFASILMTYFGVNFYLAGLHSYAKGEPQKTPDFIYYIIGGIIIISILAYYKFKKYYRNT
jgi:cytochrome c-type biogenesis protein CcsB